MGFWRNEPLELSFGIEWEGLVTFPEGKYPLRTSREYQIFTTVQAGIETVRPKYDKWTIMLDESIKDGGDWVQWPKGKQYAGIEAVSPVFRCSSLRDAAAEIRAVFQCLERAHGPLQVNQSTGLHIHVGTPPGKPQETRKHIPFCTVKSLALLVIALEHVINSIIPEERLGLDEPEYVLPFSTMRRGHLIPTYQQDNISIWDQLEAVQRSRSNGELIKAVQGEGRYSRFVHVNLRNLPTDPSIVETGTVEFRFFPSTTSADEVQRAVEFVVGLTQIAHEATGTEVDSVIRRALLDPSFTVFQLSEVIGRKDLREPFAALYKPAIRIPGLEPPWHSASLSRLDGDSVVIGDD